MRFYILSDLHLRAEVENYKTSERIKRLCSKIRTATDIGEHILFVILGDIADKGEEISFETANANLSLIRDELKDYIVEFEFVPGNHDLNKDSLFLFNQLTAVYGGRHFQKATSVFSKVYDGVNFIFADSTLSRDFEAPGRLDLDEIRANVKAGMSNILFCHHAISHGHGSSHDVIEDGATVLAQLNSMGIAFFFHGHVHDTNVTIPENGLIEVGCGSLSGGIDWLTSVFHQFLVAYIQESEIVLIERWLDAGDGHREFALNELYPKPKTFSDPDMINRIIYNSVNNYIPRWVSLYEDANQNPFVRFLAQEKRSRLRSALQRHKKILLLCDAGMGKSIELKNLAYELCKKFHTLFYSLKYYTGQDIHDLLPDDYRGLPPNRIALLLDGYDELDSSLAKKFKTKLSLYIKEETGVNIVISSRSNFCGKENGNSSQTFPGFYTYVLDALETIDVNKHLESEGIDVSLFWRCAESKRVSEFLFNPFYLMRLSKFYAKENDLPPKNKLMDKLIIETFDVDDQKFSGDLDARYHELFSILESLAVAMQLMHQQSFDDRAEYQELFSFDERELIKKSGLLKREGATWSFLHNNFREYLAARYLAHLPQELVSPMFYDGTNIRPYWVNTLGYLTGFDLSWSLIEWLIENSPSALVKFEPDRLNKELRIDVFKRIFYKYETLRLHINDDLCNIAELAHFVNSDEILLFLLERIRNPQHSVSQYTAVNLLRNYPSLFGKENIVRESLLMCCEQYPVTDKAVCRLAILAICQHNLQTTETTRRLMEKFLEVDTDYIRSGMYEYLLKTNEHNNYVEYCLSGIDLISYHWFNDTDENRIGDESFGLLNCLNNMSTVNSVTQLLEWFSQDKQPDFYDSEKVLTAAITAAIELYQNGHMELFDSILSFYLESAKLWNTMVSKAMVQFFMETETQYKVALFVAEQFEDSPHHLVDLIYSDFTIIEYLKTAYLDGNLKSHRAFREIVLWYVRDEMMYKEYAEMIKETDGIDLPEYRVPIDYDALKRKAAQEYYEILFDAEKRQALTIQLINAIGNPDVTTKQLLETDIKVDRYSALRRLQLALYHYDLDVKVSEFFNCIDIDEFIIQSIARYLSEESVIVPTQTEKEYLSEIIARILKNRNFENSITYYPNGFSLKPIIEEILTVIQYLDYPLDESTLLNLTEIPAYIFNRNNEKSKYMYLKQKITIDKLKSRLIQNVATQRVKSMVLEDHINFFESCRDASLSEYALKICNDRSDLHMRSIAWCYLYNTLGAEFIGDEILSIADEGLLLEIAAICKDISREKLCEAMRREYEKTRSIQLQAYLITYGNSIAINDYVLKVMRDKCIPEGKKNHRDGSTAAISSICNPAFLPQLETLLVTVFDPDFEDATWNGLRNSLMKAFVRCGMAEREKTIQLIKNNRPSADVNERDYRYCNCIIEEIEQAIKSSLDIAMTLPEVKKFLKKAKSTANV